MTSGPALAVQRAKAINEFCGGAVIAPWQIGQLDDFWTCLFDGLIYDLPQMRAAYAHIAQTEKELTQHL